MATTPIKLRKLPISVQDFEVLRSQNYMYVDKTLHIYNLVDTGKAFFLARPRRFGKSLLCSTLKYLFLGNRTLFTGLWIDQSDWTWKEHPVIHISMSQLPHNTVAELGTALHNTFMHLAHTYNVTLNPGPAGQMFSNLIVALATQGEVVVIIDEYDKPMINQLHKINELNAFRVFFKELYGALKDCDAQLKFLFITGVSQFSMVSIFSDLNHIDNLSTTKLAASLCGYTQYELETVFGEHLERICVEEKIALNELLLKTKRWYNGYCFTTPEDNVDRVYNPFSLLQLFRHFKFKNYWFNSGTPSFVIELLKNDTLMLTDFEQVKASNEMLDTLVPERPSATTMLYQTGYLTIQSYDQDSDLYTLGFPNFEVARSCSEQLFMHQTGLTSSTILRTVATKIEALFISNQLVSCKQQLEDFFAQVPYYLKPADERGYQTIFYIILNMLGLNVTVEDATTLGRVDATIKTKQNIFVVEFKIRGTAQQAIQQIKDKRYAYKYAPIGLPIIFIGIIFDPEVRTVTEILFEDFKRA